MTATGTASKIHQIAIHAMQDATHHADSDNPLGASIEDIRSATKGPAYTDKRRGEKTRSNMDIALEEVRTGQTQ